MTRSAQVSGLRPRTVEWKHVCRSAHHPLSAPSVRTPRIEVLHTAALCHRQRCSKETERLASEVLRTAALDLLADLHQRRVLCDSSTPCRVLRSNQSAWVLSICLPRQLVPVAMAAGQTRLDRRAYLCEPYGELWQQMGSYAGNFTPDGCAQFDLRLLAFWWRRLRSASPFFAQPRRAGVDGDSRMLFAADQKASAEPFTTYKPLPTAEYRTPGWLGSRPPPLSPEEKKRKAASAARHMEALLGFLDEVRASQRRQMAAFVAPPRTATDPPGRVAIPPRSLRALEYERCAFVGSGW